MWPERVVWPEWPERPWLVVDTAKQHSDSAKNITGDSIIRISAASLNLTNKCNHKLSLIKKLVMKIKIVQICIRFIMNKLKYVKRNWKCI